jgi:hypothetical protein
MGAKPDRRWEDTLMKKGWISDPWIALSWINTKLRDGAKDLDGICEEWEISRFEIETVLFGIGYRYDPLQKRFVALSE